MPKSLKVQTEQPQQPTPPYVGITNWMDAQDTIRELRGSLRRGGTKNKLLDLIDFLSERIDKLENDMYRKSDVDHHHRTDVG